MTTRIREGQAKQNTMPRCGEGAELATIGQQIVQPEHWDRGSITARLVAQAVFTACREPSDPWSSGWVRSDGTAFHYYEATGSPARGDGSTVGR